jgi:phosphatidylinositol alpha-1,6-mannosyltransferase
VLHRVNWTANKLGELAKIRLSLRVRQRGDERSMEIVGIFPSFDSEKYGGIQVSGRTAWQSVLRRVGQGQCKALFYTPGDSKAMAVVSAMITPPSKRILVWHIHFAKLIPLVAAPRARVVLFLHGIEAWRRLDRLTRLALRRVQLFLSNTDFTWVKFITLNPEFAHVAHQTVHLGCGSASNETVAGGSPSSVLMVGRLRRAESYKGHKEMISAWPLVLRSNPVSELWIAGDGDLRPELEQLAKELGVEQQVKFHGSISESEKDSLIARCRCLAMPSRGEGFGLVYLEAMRMGRPCLVSDQDAGREVVNPPEGGLAANPDDLQQLAEATARLLTAGSAWDQFSSQARRRYEAQFTAEHFRQRLNQALFAV